MIVSAATADKSSRMGSKSGTTKHYTTANFEILPNFMIAWWFVVPDLDLILVILLAIPAETITTFSTFFIISYCQGIRYILNGNIALLRAATLCEKWNLWIATLLSGTLFMLNNMNTVSRLCEGQRDHTENTTRNKLLRCLLGAISKS